MARSGTGFQCHAHTSLVSFERHHVWPIGYHGPNTADNIVQVCCNAHSDIHYLLQLMLTGRPYNLTEYGPNIRYLAFRGYGLVMAYGESLSPKET